MAERKSGFRHTGPGSTPPGQSIDVTFDATQVNQPGDYLGHIKVKTSYTIPDVQVTMHVPLPDDWGTWRAP